VYLGPAEAAESGMRGIMPNWKEKSIFEAFGVADFRKSIASYDLIVCPREPVKVRIVIFELGDGTFSYRNSHHMAIPGYGAFLSSSIQNPALTPEEALEFGLKELLFHYQDAIEKGHTPSAKWFPRTPGFDA
jgi:hypothetical protein